MRLINVENFEVEEFFDSAIPEYAILSHTWGEEEVTFQDWQDPLRRQRKRGYQKIFRACEQASKDRFSYLWIDTNCINKDSSAELTEAINSMYTWYERAIVCYVYLDDLPPGSEETQLPRCRWFRRGWTLQELLAPRRVVFYNQLWNEFGDKSYLAGFLEDITGIRKEYLLQDAGLHRATIAERMSWAASRETSRVEDHAYSLMGIFDVNMPLLYGEGTKAFSRLQEEIAKHTGDQTILTWMVPSTPQDRFVGCFAPSSKAFRDTREFVPLLGDEFTVTNIGLRIHMFLLFAGGGLYTVAGLAATAKSQYSTRACILLATAQNTRGGDVYFRVNSPIWLVPRSWFTEEARTIYIRHEQRYDMNSHSAFLQPSHDSDDEHIAYGILPLFSRTENLTSRGRFIQSLRWTGSPEETSLVGYDPSVLYLRYQAGQEYLYGRIWGHYDDDSARGIRIKIKIRVRNQESDDWNVDVLFLVDNALISTYSTTLKGYKYAQYPATDRLTHRIRPMLIDLDGMLQGLQAFKHSNGAQYKRCLEYKS